MRHTLKHPYHTCGALQYFQLAHKVAEERGELLWASARQEKLFVTDQCAVAIKKAMEDYDHQRAAANR
jgi:hypothetical protein